MSTLKFNALTVLNAGEKSDEELLHYASSLSDKEGDLKNKILHWEFGPIMNMKFDENASNYLFSAEEVPLHWDGAFYKEPSHLLFYCVESLGVGGETIFVNTEALWNDLTTEEKLECESITLKYFTEKKAHYGGEINVPLVQKHPVSGRTILRLAERVETSLNPVGLQIESSRGIDTTAFYKKMCEKLYDPKYLYEHSWQKGDLVVCDNFTFLHGRRALKSNLKRSFKRIQIL
ncbi:TauD/TfdA family dioxygenase [Bacteriovorax stolpii]|uniref:Pyoverdine biosynthesis protein n=1 Tax=Bacteriovorax stolpii TaxID=960 RepID=A0A2K9NMZ9_BACTC|nr:TauD/TfdA family dioxygenase [Bacteriovorax stolpii]AUN96880.1 pyoverdine biosynthesis protein [Bacteriovorax stolpii]QDK43191.1 TauD/TfdA family dioxygenase [Bacteriovorax stolpii]TDP53158.1 3-(4-hydroxyphenyl)acrylonitrile synthase [Bacteriovorax stolpii]